MQVSSAVGEWANSGVYSSQIFPGQVQNEAALSSSTLPAGRTGTQAHVSTTRGQ